MPWDKDERIIRIGAAILFVASAVINGFRFASVILLLAAVLVLPIEEIDSFILRLKPLVALSVILALILVGVMTVPISNMTDKQNNGPTISTGNTTPQFNNSGSSIGNSSGNQNSDNNGGNTNNSNNDTESGSSSGSDNSSDSGNSSEDNKDDNNFSEEDYEEKTFILNLNNEKFHLPDCRYAELIDEKNREEYYGTRANLIAEGYEPCKVSKP